LSILPACFDFSFLQKLPDSSGVYRMMGDKEQVLYIGKARNLKKRIYSYTRQQDSRISAMLRQVIRIETTITETEQQALLLECNLIKQLRPRYNIRLRDDKSYPYLALSKSTNYPSLNLYRGRRTKERDYFGPYPSVASIRSSLNQLQKLFKIRSCSDSFFRNRVRPCMQYQIKRCSGPCVGLISSADYQANVKHAVLFLQGKDQAVIHDLIQQMENASADLNYEQATVYRDQIVYLRQIQQQSARATKGEVAVVACVRVGDHYCIYFMPIRAGRLLGGRAYFPEVPLCSKEEEVIAAFILHFYIQSESESTIPRTIISSHSIAQTVQTVLKERAKHRIIVTTHPKNLYQRWLAMALENARSNLQSHQIAHDQLKQRFADLQTILKLPNELQRLECFDVSHTQGEATTASCVVFTQQGPDNHAYRRFNIKSITGGDDYAALRQALQRHYLRITLEEKILPDVLIIDGGLGQLKQAKEVLDALQISAVTIMAIAKGPTRKPGLETIFLSGHRDPIIFTDHKEALHLIQHIRDEAHRFAITGHRKRRALVRSTSSLQTITGIGPRRRQALLKQFGGLRQLREASVEELQRISGINKVLAKKIYAALHEPF